MKVNKRFCTVCLPLAPRLQNRPGCSLEAPSIKAELGVNAALMGAKKAFGESGATSLDEAFLPRHRGRAALPGILYPLPPGTSWDHEIKADAQNPKEVTTNLSMNKSCKPSSGV